MNFSYLRLAGSLEVLIFFVVAPALSLFIGYKAWRDKNLDVKTSLKRCAISAAVALTLLAFGHLLEADPRSPLFLLQFILQFVCSLLGLVLFAGVSMGYGFPLFLCMWRWHNATRLRSRE